MSTLQPNLSISIVIYTLDTDLLNRTLVSLVDSLEEARDQRLIGSVTVDLVDNGENRGPLNGLLSESTLFGKEGVKVTLRAGHGNVGYGRGHNASLQHVRSDFHLVLNPDVILAPSAISEAIRHMAEHPATVMITPEVRGRRDERQYLCRQYPSLGVLYLRSFAPQWLRERTAKKLARYELRDVIDQGVCASVPVATGCFMLARTRPLREIGGFSPSFFLYFEDYDLSLRIRQLGEVVYVPSVRITHFGGEASKKGVRHIAMFVRSGVTFFRRHGWRVW